MKPKYIRKSITVIPGSLEGIAPLLLQYTRT